MIKTNPNTKLSKNFILSEFIVSQSAARRGIDNSPPPNIVENLKVLAEGLELVRGVTKSSIIISSGYRSPELNAAVGGSRTSQHMTGNAADFTSPKFGDPKKVMEAIIKAKIPFDQCILEFYNPDGGGWVHISFVKENPRRNAIIIDSKGVRTWV